MPQGLADDLRFIQLLNSGAYQMRNAKDGYLYTDRFNLFVISLNLKFRSKTGSILEHIWD